MPLTLRHGRARVLLALGATTLLIPATAHAAYAPKLAVSVSPATPASKPKLVTTITQAAGESASRRVSVSLPAGYSAPQSIGSIPICTTQQLNARACPESTRIGSAEATGALLGLLPVPLTGPVVWGGPTDTGDLLVIVLLDNASLDQHLTLKGTVALRADGGFDTTFDALPDILTTRFALTFDGGPKAIVQTPTTCAPLDFRASFTAHNGAQASSVAPVALTGCGATAPTLRKVRLTTKAVSYKLGAAAKVRVLIKRGTRKVYDRTRSNTPGTRTVVLPSRLKRGSYKVAVTATGPGGGVVTKKAALTVRR